MVRRRKINFTPMMISLFISLLVFSVGIYSGILISEEKIEFFEKKLNEVKIFQKDTALRLLLLQSFGNESCEFISYEIDKIMEEAEKLGKVLTDYEVEGRHVTPKFIELKKDYTLTLIHLWNYLETMKKICGKKDFLSIIYFYSNRNCEECAEQGLILSYLKKKYPSNVMIFALDFDFNLGSLNILKHVYQIKKLPTLIVDGEKFEGKVDLETLENELCEKINICGEGS